MNGKDGRLVYLPFRQQQRAGRQWFIRNLIQQPLVEWIVGALAQAGHTQFVNIAANTPAQLFRRGFGKRYD